MTDKSFNIETFLQNVERADNALVVVSPYGFKKVELEGKTYLQAMTKEDLIASLSESKDERHVKLVADLKLDIDQVSPRCIPSSSTVCQVLGGCRGCIPERAGGGGFLCYCIN